MASPAQNIDRRVSTSDDAPTYRSIGLFFPPTLGYYAEVVMGIQEYAQSVLNWVVEVCPTLDIAIRTCRNWTPNGVLASYTEGNWAPFLSKLRQKRTAIVQVGGPAIKNLPRVSTDNYAIGRLAAEHLLERGLQRFAFIGYDRVDWSEEREASQRDRLALSGCTCTAFRSTARELIYAGAVSARCAGWVRGLPKPVAIFACHDRMAMLISNACTLFGIAVPQDVAIIGVDNDLLHCGFATPGVSSVMGSSRRIGYEAAVMLDAMMNGKPAPKQPLFISPAGIAVRQSTDVSAITDPDVVAALRFIREHAIEEIDVDDVVNATFLSRRNLERKFQASLRRTPYEEIVRARIAHAKMLLLSTSIQVLDVALQSGFPSASQFSAVFRRETNMSPSLFRRLYSTRAPADAVKHQGAS